MKITDVYIRRISSKYEGELKAYSDSCIVNATDIYPDFVRHASASRVKITPVPDENRGLKITHDFLYIDTDEGISGVVGPLTFPGITYSIINSLKYVLLGQDPMRINYLWSIMYRVAADQGAGDMVRAISHAEAALWDIKCKKLNLPLYELLGGKFREGAPMYTNTAGLPHEDEILLPILKAQMEDGAPGCKIYSKYGPAEGTEGIRKTRKTLEAVRDCIGPDKFIAVEAVCCWDYDYTMKFADMTRDLNLEWLEEPCLVDRMDEYAALRRNCGVKISGGEHSIYRWPFRDMLEKGACDIYQPDPVWSGGIGEVMRIIDLVGTYNRKVYQHSAIPNINAHMMVATSPAIVPMTEYLLTINTASQYFLKYISEPVNGNIVPPDVPGVGCDIDEAKVQTEEKIQ